LETSSSIDFRYRGKPNFNTNFNTTVARDKIEKIERHERIYWCTLLVF